MNSNKHFVVMSARNPIEGTAKVPLDTDIVAVSCEGEKEKMTCAKKSNSQMLRLS